MSLLVRVILTLIILGMAYFALVRVWTKDIDIIGMLKKPSESIAIKGCSITTIPDEFKLGTSDWDETHVLEIKNLDVSKTYYSIWVKLWAEINDSSLDNIEIIPEPGKSFISADAIGVKVDFEMVMVTGIDNSKRPCIYLIIYRLEGHESKFIKVKKIGSSLAKQRASKLLIKVLSCDELPAPIVSGGGKALLRVNVPEIFDTKAMYYEMSKDK
jgi:hypothetical protein